MKLLTYMAEDGPRSGALLGDRVLDTADAATRAGLDNGRDWQDNRAVLEAGPDAWREIERAARGLLEEDAGLGGIADLALGPPVMRPDKIICVGANYHDHIAEVKLPIPEVPLFFAKFPNALVGHRQPVEIPLASDQIDYEAELALVIGRTARQVSEEDALSHVAGLMCFNDISARDLQFQTSQFIAGKASDTFGPCGPTLVPLDDIVDVQALPIEARVNGKVVQASNTRDMIFSVAHIVSFMSRLMTLVPGDIISTGTPAGVGFTASPPKFLVDGDVCEIEIGGLGTLTNTVVKRHR